MSEKMTAEDFALFRRVAAGDIPVGEDALRSWLVYARDHIAALEAERDEWKTEAEMKQAALTGVSRTLDEVAAERNTSAKKVKELERELDLLSEALSVPAGVGLREWAETVVTRMNGAESSLAAIRKRAVDDDGLSRFIRGWEREMDGGEWELEKLASAVARFILGDDTPAQEAKAEQPELRLRPISEHVTPGNRSLVERWGEPAPSTAEAFAGLKSRRQWWSETGEGTPAGNEARLDLSDIALLERRMGAMARALRIVSEQGVDSQWVENGRRMSMQRIARAALTDAPEVYTREEVERAFRATSASSVPDTDWNALSAHLTALRSK